MTPLMPGSTVGIVGGGQLARMLALEARRMDYRTVVLDPDPRCAAGVVADRHLVAPLDQMAAEVTLAQLCDVVTLDTEHVPLRALERLERLVPTCPGSRVLSITQDRLRQRDELAAGGFPQTQYVGVAPGDDAATALAAVGGDGVLKTRREGYDGRGQARVRSPLELTSALERLGAPAVLEAFVPFSAEISVVVARSRSGRVESFPVSENIHERHVLSYTVVPARVSSEVQARATALAEAVATRLGVVGLCAVELFVTASGALLVNEVAARSHNSGHYTWGGTDVSQFEQQLRAICDLPLARPSALAPTVMMNLMGELWEHGEPPWHRVLGMPGVRLHLYGKAPRPGRKMGHLLLLNHLDPDRATREVRRLLTPPAVRRVNPGDPPLSHPHRSTAP